ncbi:hypothetical protein MHI24_21565 [Paenibacillus sp. FSL K6-1096]|uniref:hypothetical protein n=1 Tax=Paenibacillus sp. FSL K6-1096 TaxID=2921460 RepID=UPI0030EDE3E1
MKKPGDNERLLKEYFNTPLTPSPRLVSSTIRRIQGRGSIGIIVGLMALQWLVFIMIAGFFLAGPAALPWVISLLLLFVLAGMVAAALLLYRMTGGREGAGAYENSLHR